MYVTLVHCTCDIVPCVHINRILCQTLWQDLDAMCCVDRHSISCQPAENAAWHDILCSKIQDHNTIPVTWHSGCSLMFGDKEFSVGTRYGLFSLWIIEKPMKNIICINNKICHVETILILYSQLKKSKAVQKAFSWSLQPWNLISPVSVFKLSEPYFHQCSDEYFIALFHHFSS